MMMAKLETRLAQETPDTWTLTIRGSVDQENFQLLAAIESNAILNRLVETHARRLIIDLTGTEQFDSLGLQLLLLLYKHLTKRNIQVILRNPNSHLRRVLRIMQFDRIFRVMSDDYSSSTESQMRVSL